MKRLIDSFQNIEDGRTIAVWVALTGSGLGLGLGLGQRMGLNVAALLTARTGSVRRAEPAGQTMKDRGIPAF